MSVQTTVKATIGKETIVVIAPAGCPDGDNIALKLLIHHLVGVAMKNCHARMDAYEIVARAAGVSSDRVRKVDAEMIAESM